MFGLLSERGWVSRGISGGCLEAGESVEAQAASMPSQPQQAALQPALFAFFFVCTRQAETAVGKCPKSS
eukprot:354181-Chlamydomonas_euryale.AAC.1